MAGSGAAVGARASTAGSVVGAGARSELGAEWCSLLAPRGGLPRPPPKHSSTPPWGHAPQFGNHCLRPSHHALQRGP